MSWHSEGQDGSGYGVYGQVFDGNGSNIGSEFRANTYVTLDQWGPSVASFSNGNFVVTWNSENQDSSGDGVYGQIFNDFLVSSTTSTSTSSTTPGVSSSTSVPSTSTTSSTTSSVSSSTTSTSTSSMTPSVSSSTTSAIGRTGTSVNPSSSTTVPSTTRPITTINSRTTFPTTSDPSNRFSWVWFLLGGVGAVSCLGLTGYFIFKSRNRKKDGDGISVELGEREQTGDSTVETPYHLTPDHVTQEETHYQRTPDHVTAGAEDGPLYGVTPDFVTAGDGRH